VDTDDEGERTGGVGMRRLVAAAVVVAVLALLAIPVWRENERRYEALRMTGCFGDSATSALGASQPCTGSRRLCRDVPPLIDWRGYCD
jgi:hypothetical protein